MSMFRSYRDLERTPSKVNYNHNKTTPYNCDLCDQGGWTSETEVEIHRKTAHLQHIISIIKDKKKFPCMVCAKDHLNKHLLYQHIKSIHFMSSEDAERIQREIFICDHCCRVFFNKSLLGIHMVRKHKRVMSKNWSIECPKCCKLLKKSCLWGHLEYHRISSVSTCPICLEKCASRTNLSKHLQKHRRHYDCGVCEFRTRIEANFDQHLRNHRKLRHMDSNGPDRLLHKYYMPKLCKPSSIVNYSVPSIMKGLKIPNNIHICIICRHICVSKWEMKEHLASDHTTLEEERKKIYMCVCKEVFFNKILLKQHVFKEKEGHRVMNEVELEAAIRETQTPEVFLEPSDEETVTEEVVTDGIVTNDIVTDDIVTNDIVTDDIVTNDIVTDDIVTDDIVTNDIVTDDIVTDDIVTDDIVTDDIVTDDIVTHDIVKDEIMTVVVTVDLDEL